MKKIWALIVFLSLCFGAGAIGSIFTVSSVNNWYLTLEKPALTPPAAVFAPVWSVLYVMMAVAAWLVWLTGKPERRRALLVFFAQLVFNTLWSIIFFGFRAPGLAVVELTILWAFIIGAIMEFWKVRPAAAILLFPYFLWVTFAGLLNYGIWKLN